VSHSPLVREHLMVVATRTRIPQPPRVVQCRRVQNLQWQKQTVRGVRHVFDLHYAQRIISNLCLAQLHLTGVELAEVKEGIAMPRPTPCDRTSAACDMVTVRSRHTALASPTCLWRTLVAVDLHSGKQRPLRPPPSPRGGRAVRGADRRTRWFSAATIMPSSGLRKHAGEKLT
jgi:hypothetical protein